MSEGRGQLQKLSLAALGEIDDGRLATAFDQAIKRAADDCNDRPGEKRKRCVVLQIEFEPVLDQDGVCDSVKSAVQIKDTIPTRKSRSYDFGLRKGGFLVFNENSLDSHRQSTIFDQDLENDD